MTKKHDKSKQVWVEKSQKEKDVSKKDEVVSKNVKINSQDFKDQVDKFSKENNISKRQARTKVFLNKIRSRKKAIILHNKSSEQQTSKSVQTSFASN